ncbi:MAG: tyrosine-type recombinase/integrase [Candidatus Dojkabacteria bacterium]
MVHPIISKFEDKLKEEKKSIYTIIAYTKDIEQFLHFCTTTRTKELKNIDSTDIEAFIEDRKKKGYTLKSISRKLNSIKTFYRFCIEHNHLNQNPSSQISHPKLESQIPRVLTTQEYRALRDVCKKDQRLYSIVELLIQTGIKIGELCRMETDDITYKNSKPASIRIKRYESSLERDIPLNQAASKAIADYLEIRPKFDHKKALFLTKTGNPLLMRNIRFYLDRAFKKAGIKDATVNDLRNTFIAHHLAKGTSILFISQVVGHKRVSTTERYAHLLGISGQKHNHLEVL